MFKIGDTIEGTVYNEDGEQIKVIGKFVARTNDPEECIQDIIVRTEEGKIVYIDEQDARLVSPIWTIAKVLNGFADLPHERFHTFAIKRDGVIVGELKFVYRPKNAGGYAWKGTFHGAGPAGMDVCFYDCRKEKVLEWFKTTAV